MSLLQNAWTQLNKCNKNNRLQASINREVALGQNSIKQEIMLIDGDYEITIKSVNEGPSVIVNILPRIAE